ncbi:hypothetical protein C3486_28150 [Streptomyces sp. Ru73]|uniref:DUF6507 family protein n=1 Tax=Streptomyces sp. Ru73 TaxID=2080748 RepID=UPI000CDD1FAE|nr:DUF6507 family protein [Streptomyces sp. Ru73]POX37467.1 hypothetical protein C3486_28150 [Streptomyces sp. Ru73]
MKFDISPSGMHETGRKATRRGDDIDADVRALLDALGDAGAASGGALAGALARLSGDVQQKTGIMSSRVACTVDGAGRATGMFDDGDHEMKGNAHQGIDRANSAGNSGLGPGGR